MSLSITLFHQSTIRVTPQPSVTIASPPQVTFLLTEDPSHRRVAARRRRSKRSREHLSPDRFSLYSALSAASGGLTVFTTNAQIHKVSAIVEDSTVADKVLDGQHCLFLDCLQESDAKTME